MAEGPVTPCPKCHINDATRIRMPIAADHVVYLRCNHCAHIWTVDTRTGAKIADVTPLGDR